MRRLVELALKNRSTVWFLLAAVTVAGVSAYRSLPRESFPDITIPMVMVYTRYVGASPADVETQITDPIEQELQGVDDLKKLTSVSQESVSVVTVEFQSGTDVDTALQKVRDKVDLAKADLPEDAEDPVLQEINFSDIPIIQVNLAGDVGPVVLKELAEDLEDELEAIPGVLRVNVVGGLEREVRVDVDPERLRLYGLSLDDVVEAVRDENVSIPGGELDLGDESFAVRVPGEVEDPLGVRDFVIEARAGNPIYVRDVAEVTYGFEDRTSFARINGRESVALAVQKRQGANIIAVAERVKAEVARAQERWPSGVEVSMLGDQSKDIRTMVSDLENNILSGLVLVVLVLMVALGFRNALFVGAAIPLSMLMTFMLIELSGTTLNMVVLFSLVLAVGMLVDNGVVVVENIYRHMQQGKGRWEAALVGTKEVALAIAVSTATTVAAFFPLLFWPGITGDFMSFLPQTVSLVLLSSLLVAFTANPVLCATFMKVRPKDLKVTSDEAEEAGPEDDDADDGAPRGRAGDFILERYRRSLRWALRHRGLTVGATVASFVAVVGLYGAFGHGVEFFPSTEPPQIFVNVEMPPGTRLERTDEVMRRLEARLADLPDVRVMAAGVGAGSQSTFGVGDSGDATRARITLDLIDRGDREQSSFLTMDQARAIAEETPGASVEVSRPDEGPSTGPPVALEISGPDFVTLGAIATRIREEIRGIPGLVSLTDDYDQDRPEVVIHVDRAEAARLGLTTRDVASTVRTAVTGTEASSFRRSGDDEVDITVRLAEASRRDLGDLSRITVVNETGAQIPLSAVARLEEGASLTSIRHQDRKRLVTVSGDTTDPKLAGPVRAEARERLEAIPDLLPAGYGISFGGQSEDEQEAIAFLSKAFLYAILLVLALIVAQFDSVAIPFIIMTSVLMSMVGVLLGLIVTGLPFGIIMTGIGVISLAGVVVNNAIVLLDYGEQLRKRGVPRRKLVMLTGERRLRPVLLTAITTILGLIPLSTGIDFDFRSFTFGTGGESSQWWRGMGVAVIFGLAFATFLTLILVPVMYDLLLQWRERRGGRRAPDVGEEVEDEERPPDQPSRPERDFDTAAALEVGRS